MPPFQLHHPSCRYSAKRNLPSPVWNRVQEQRWQFCHPLARMAVVPDLGVSLCVNPGILRIRTLMGAFFKSDCKLCDFFKYWRCAFFPAQEFHWLPFAGFFSSTGQQSRISSQCTSVHVSDCVWQMNLLIPPSLRPLDYIGLLNSKNLTSVFPQWWRLQGKQLKKWAEGARLEPWAVRGCSSAVPNRRKSSHRWRAFVAPQDGSCTNASPIEMLDFVGLQIAVMYEYVW